MPDGGPPQTKPTQTKLPKGDEGLEQAPETEKPQKGAAPDGTKVCRTSPRRTWLLAVMAVLSWLLVRAAAAAALAFPCPYSHGPYVVCCAASLAALHTPPSPPSPNLALGRRHRPQSAPRGLASLGHQNEKKLPRRRGGMPQPD